MGQISACVQSRKRETIFINQTLNKSCVFFHAFERSHIEHTVNKCFFPEKMSSPCVYTVCSNQLLHVKVSVIGSVKVSVSVHISLFSVQNVGAFQVGLQK